MRRLVAAIAFLLLGAYTAGQTPEGRRPAPAREPWLVSTAWVQEHLPDKGLVVVQMAGTRREFRQGHVPGARFLWSQAYAPSTPDGSYGTCRRSSRRRRSSRSWASIPTRASSSCTRASRIQQAARAVLTFEQFGLGRRVSIMNGGFDAWRAEGRPVSTGSPEVAPGTAAASPGGRFVVDAAYVQARLEAPGTAIVDARDTRFYNGDGGGQPRPGHIPGAVNIPYSSLIAGTRIREDEGELRQVFAAAGVERGREIVSYCHIGQQASLVWLVARMLGYEARLYDGSFEDWSGRSELPVVNPSAVKR